MASSTQPGETASVHMDEALHCLVQHWSGLDGTTDDNTTKDSSSWEDDECSSGAVSARGQLVDYLCAIILPMPHASTQETSQDKHVTDELLKQVSKTPKQSGLAASVAELLQCADEFNAARCYLLDEESRAEACSHLSANYTPDIHTTLFTEIVAPIIKQGATDLLKFIATMAVVREVLRKTPGIFRVDEREKMARTAEEVMKKDLLKPLVERRGGVSDGCLLYSHDQKLINLPENEQVAIKRSLCDENYKGVPAWRRFAEVNFEEQVNESEGIDVFWIRLLEEDYTVGKLYGYLIGAGLFCTARKLEA